MHGYAWYSICPKPGAKLLDVVGIALLFSVSGSRWGAVAKQPQKWEFATSLLYDKQSCPTLQDHPPLKANWTDAPNYSCSIFLCHICCPLHDHDEEVLASGFHCWWCSLELAPTSPPLRKQIWLRKMEYLGEGNSVYFQQWDPAL